MGAGEHTEKSARVCESCYTKQHLCIDDQHLSLVLTLTHSNLAVSLSSDSLTSHGYCLQKMSASLKRKLTNWRKEWKKISSSEAGRFATHMQLFREQAENYQREREERYGMVYLSWNSQSSWTQIRNLIRSWLFSEYQWGKEVVKLKCTCRRWKVGELNRHVLPVNHLNTCFSMKPFILKIFLTHSHLSLFRLTSYFSNLKQSFKIPAHTY